MLREEVDGGRNKEHSGYLYTPGTRIYEVTFQSIDGDLCIRKLTSEESIRVLQRIHSDPSEYQEGTRTH